MMPQPKIKREIDKAYLQYIKKQPCIITGQKAEPHHTQTRGAFGSDYSAVPLSRIPHSECHYIGQHTFQKKYGISFNESVTKLLINYIKLLKAKP